MATTYCYKPLSPEPGTIRLIRLFKSPPTDPIRCELFEASLQDDDGITYQAVSYTWGSNAVTESITVEEEHTKGRRTSPMLNVTTNLHTALRYIRSRDIDLVLWIDAICIDQGSLQEKSCQIGQMKLVYEKAEEVLIWLGHGSDENVEAAMDAMCRLHDEARTDRKAWRDPTKRPEIAGLVFRRQFANVPGSTFQQHVDAFKELLARPWFKRVWVIQEVASARSATVLFGSRSAPAAIFALMPSFLGVKVDSHTQAVLDILPGHSRQESWWNQRRDLLYLLKMFASSQTSEPRDRIYALLGISSDASDTNVFSPDYEISLKELLQKTLSFFLFGSAQSLSAQDKIDFPTRSLTGLTHYADDPKRLASEMLQWSVKTRHDSTTSKILSHHGFDMDRCLLYDLIESGGYDEVIEHHFLHGEVDLTLIYRNWETLLQVALRKKDVKTTKLLLEKAGIRIDAERLETLKLNVMKRSIPPVSVLMGWNEGDTIPGHGRQLDPTFLEAMGVPTKAPRLLRKEVRTPYAENEVDALLSSAARKDDVNELSRVIHGGVNPCNYRDAWGGTLLSLAAREGSLSVVRFILDEMGERFDVNAKDCDGRTALSFAAEGGYLGVVKLLAEHGADRAAKDNSGKRIVDWLEDSAGKKDWRFSGETWGSHLADWRASLYGSEIAL
ncbi:heterokaryon incompatibility protein-domain-containing protein [Plectosphaerella plurivora]|uniref:Heterokaryon incompatibility protein-domain-containing protein n=1 Tax=Plectosphaerella plurivora TaxID=936078 RepID=A0A9P9AFK0_9PEZI|nr:heterokaryon incompatibility protein-domain-containing protein [Plectosphaerella plurivora]